MLSWVGLGCVVLGKVRWPDWLPRGRTEVPP
jgi:hypothetical protein